MSAVLHQDRDRAFALLSEYTNSDSLIKHALSVEAAMRWYAGKFGENQDFWGITGLLHDFDYERFPNPEEGGHPYSGSKILREQGYPEEMIEAILGHATFSGVERKTMMAKALFACDELCGLITASVLVRPDKNIHQLEVSSVKKKMKDRAFAKGVNRDDIRLGVEEMAIDLDTHIGNVIEAMRGISDALGLSGRPA